MSKPTVELLEPSGKRYRIWADGRSDGFVDGVVISNGILPLLQYAQCLQKKAIDHGLLAAEEAADLLA